MSAELRREVLLARRRRRLALAAVAAVAATFAAAIAMWPRDRVRTVHVTTTRVVPVPAPVPIVRTVVVPAERAACPLPRTDAPRSQPAQPPEPVERIQPAATNAGWIAAWNEQHVFVSMDAGASWQRAFDGRGAVRDVDFDCHGRAIAVRGSRLGVREGGRERWHPLHHIELADEHSNASVIGGGPDVVVIGHPRRDDDAQTAAQLLISRDHGVTWERHTLADYWEGHRIAGRQYEDGRILAVLSQPDCMHTSGWVFEYANGRVTERETTLGADLVFAGDLVVTPLRWKRLGEETLHDHAELEGYPTLVDGPRPLLAADNGLYRFVRGRLVKLPWQLPAEAGELVADRAERLWYIACGKLAIATRATPPALCDS